MSMKAMWAIVIKRQMLTLVAIFAGGLFYNLATAERYERQPIGSGLIAVALYLAVAFALTVLNSAIEALYLFTFADKDFTDACLNDLREAKLPPPTDWQSRNYDFLAELADDDTALPTDRVRAALLLGSYKAVIGTTIFRGIALRRAIDAAVMRYSHEARRAAKMQTAQETRLAAAD